MSCWTDRGGVQDRRAGFSGAKDTAQFADGWVAGYLVSYHSAGSGYSGDIGDTWCNRPYNTRCFVPGSGDPTETAIHIANAVDSFSKWLIPLALSSPIAYNETHRRVTLLETHDE